MSDEESVFSFDVEQPYFYEDDEGAPLDILHDSTQWYIEQISINPAQPEYDESIEPIEPIGPIGPYIRSRFNYHDIVFNEDTLFNDMLPFKRSSIMTDGVIDPNRFGLSHPILPKDISYLSADVIKNIFINTGWVKTPSEWKYISAIGLRSGIPCSAMMTTLSPPLRFDCLIQWEDPNIMPRLTLDMGLIQVGQLSNYAIDNFTYQTDDEKGIIKNIIELLTNPDACITVPFLTNPNNSQYLIPMCNAVLSPVIDTIMDIFLEISNPVYDDCKTDIQCAFIGYVTILILNLEWAEQTDPFIKALGEGYNADWIKKNLKLNKLFSDSELWDMYKETYTEIMINESIVNNDLKTLFEYDLMRYQVYIDYVYDESLSEPPNGN